jgi:non-ribosomal peptide synthetase component F
MTADLTRRLSSLDVLDEGERARLDGWGNRAVLTPPAPRRVAVPVVIAAQVARTPQAVALTCGGRCLTSASWRRPRTGWRICWWLMVWDRGRRLHRLVAMTAEVGDRS